jgi:hypothetical protein
MRAARPALRPAARPGAAATAFKIAMALLVLAMLLGAVAGGLLRAGAAWPGLQGSLLAGQAAVAHAALMLSAFLGSAIGVERAVALHRRWAFAAPLASALGGALLLAGQPQAGAWLGVAAAGVFVGVNTVLVLRQTLAHTALLLVGALAWLTGNLLFAADLGSGVALPWWFGFVVLTITAERLEMSRLMRHHPLAQPLLLAAVAGLLAGAAVSLFDGRTGGVLYGLALTALALWFAVFDIARRTVRAHGLSRYMALSLLGGYAWLALAGLAWLGTALGCPGRDMALHALGLGFIFSMVMGHAPVILPAVARVKLLFGAWFYLPLALLHASLLLRLFGALAQPGLRAQGALLNAVALALFAATVAGSAIAWRLRGARAPLAVALD